MRHSSPVRPGDAALAEALRREIEGEVLFDAPSRGRYSTDASIYQIEPVGVVVPRNPSDVDRALGVARDFGVPVLARGGGTSQCGQTVGEALVIDVSHHLNRIVAFDAATPSVRVQPGIVLDELNAWLKPKGLFFPVDVSTANRATIGGMTGNNSCGSRSIRYGNMVHNVRAIDALLSDGTAVQFGDVGGNLEDLSGGERHLEIVQRIRALGIRERDEVARRFPKLLRRVGGYNIDTIDPAGHNMAHLLVGSEGTLGFFTEIELALEPFPAHRVLGVCHFETFYAAMEATQQIVALDPTAVELVDRTLMDLANDIDMFRPTLERFIRGRPEALLLVEFAGDVLAPLTDRLGQLESLMADLGHPDSVVQTTEPGFQSAIWDIRKAGLNIMMSMKGEGKPVSFVEDCAVRLEDLPEYTRRLDEIFAKHGTRGTWYAHASVGTLHVRPILNMKQPEGARAMREIAEECFEMVRAYEGSHSGEHGDGLVRSEFHEAMFGERLVKAFEEVKRIFDPAGLFNPGKIVHAERMDDRGLFRYKPDYRQIPVKTELDWSDWGGLHGAVEMCNNNGACRKSNPGVMCPSYRVTLDERHVTRGRANTLRLALTGQLDGHLGDAALTSETLYDAFDLCVSCKGCRRECPTGVDMARMKIEFLSQYRQRHGWRLKHKLIAHLPRYAPWAAALAPLANARDLIPGLAWATEGLLGLSAKRPLPRWRRDAIQAPPTLPDPDKIDVLLFVDTFSRWFEPDNVRAAQRVLHAGGYRVGLAGAKKGKRPLCCGRTYLGTGMMDRARAEAVRTRDALLPFADRGIPILGLEPSCLFTFHDEFTAMLPGGSTQAIAQSSMLLEQFLFREHEAGRLELGTLKPSASQAFVHGHCHQKAFGAFDDTLAALRLVPGLEATPIESSCCGMAGPFGYEPEHYEMSMKMGELNLLPAVRNAPPEAIIVACGTSCRQQIQHGTGRNAMHPIRVLADALD